MQTTDEQEYDFLAPEEPEEEQGTQDPAPAPAGIDQQAFADAVSQAVAQALAQNQHQPQAPAPEMREEEADFWTDPQGFIQKTVQQAVRGAIPDATAITGAVQARQDAMRIIDSFELPEEVGSQIKEHIAALPSNQDPKQVRFLAETVAKAAAYDNLKASGNSRPVATVNLPGTGAVGTSKVSDAQAILAKYPVSEREKLARDFQTLYGELPKPSELAALLKGES
jgi:hypothetical protein